MATLRKFCSLSKQRPHCTKQNRWTGKRLLTKPITAGKREDSARCVTWICWNRAPGDFKNGDSRAIMWSTPNWLSSKKMRSFHACPDRRLLLTGKQSVLQSLISSIGIGRVSRLWEILLRDKTLEKDVENVHIEESEKAFLMRGFLG